MELEMNYHICEKQTLDSFLREVTARFLMINCTIILPSNSVFQFRLPTRIL